jgi:hypothetical protein
MSEVEPATGRGPNRMFLMIALGLGGLLTLGVIAIGGTFLFNQISRPAVVPTAAALRVAVTTPTRSLAAAAFTPAPADTPVATPTRVIDPVTPVAGGTTPVGEAITTTATRVVTRTVGAGTGTPGAGLPATGLGEDMLLLVAGVVLVLVIFAARRAREGNDPSAV